ncbi:type-F conjugative transfer system protein TrbI, partial [Salmonella enterica]|nr:type-F conjugative transfer system protein TrbI [Salmonella enterica]
MTTKSPETVPQTDDAASQPVPARKPLTQRDRRKRRCLLSLLLVAATLLCVNAAVTSLLISWRMPTVVAFDMKGTVDQFTDQAGAQSLNEAQTTALTERFMQTLSAELQEYQRRHDALILV